MRIPSGVTDQYIYFVAVDATDFATRETGLSSFTVYRSRNGAAAAAMTTPTINETDATNMPGVYELLLDEDMTIGSGNDSEEMVFHITATGMAPVTRTIELYRPKITAGNTLGVEADGDLTKVNTLDGHTAQTGDAYARLGAPAGASVSADIAAIEAQTDDIGAAGAGLTAIPWNSAWDAEVQSEVNDALVALHLDHAFAVDYDPASPPGVATALFNELIESDGGVARFTANALEQAPSGGGGGDATASNQTTIINHLTDIKGTTWDSTNSLEAIHDDVATVDTVVDGIQSDLDNGTDGLGALKALIDTIDGIVDQILVDTGTTLDTKIDTIDSIVDTIVAKTDQLGFTKAGEVDANVQSINGATITGDGGATPFDVA